MSAKSTAESKAKVPSKKTANGATSDGAAPSDKLDRRLFETELQRLQTELVNLQEYVKTRG